ncbi:hypothetical protein ACLB2K_019548 [Fragaria x ananassa]
MFMHMKISVGICSSFRLLISVIGGGFFDSDRKIVGDNVAVLVSFRGIYADDKDVKKLLSEKYGKLSLSELQENKEYNDVLLETDIGVTVRLQIVYGKLSIGSVRSAFEESVGTRLQKFGGSDNQELLQRFTSQFKDEIKLPQGSIIDLSREPGYVLRTTIEGNDVGSIQSKVLCKSILDLYIGEEPFDKQAREDVKLNLASVLQE